METLQGINASAGIGIGRVMIIEEPDLEYTSHTVEDTETEKQRFKAAIDGFVTKTQGEADAMRESVGEKEAEILAGHILMISDPYMQGEMEKIIEGGQCAEDALSQVCDMFAGMFEAADDELTNQRATDVRDIKAGVLAQLLNKRQVEIPSLPKDGHRHARPDAFHDCGHPPRRRGGHHHRNGRSHQPFRYFGTGNGNSRRAERAQRLHAAFRQSEGHR